MRIILLFFCTPLLFAQPWPRMEAVLTNSSTAFQENFGHAWADIDGDGDPDLFLNGRGTLWLNQVNEGKGFTKATHLLPQIDTHNGWAAAFGDFDNDGDPDIHLGNSGVDFLLENRWPEPFVNVATAMNLTDPKWCQSVNWVDFDRDGRLDIYITHEIPGVDGPHQFYRNHWPEPFVARFPQNEEPDVLGLADKNAHAYGLAWGDIDRDGDLDAITSACGSASEIENQNPHNKVYVNQFPAPVFEDQSISSGLLETNEALNGSNAYWALLFDHDGDAYLDLFIGDVANAQHRLWTNRTMTTNEVIFDKVPSSVHNLGGSGAFLRGAIAGDYDNDGDLDLYLTEAGLMENLGDGSYQSRSDLVPGGGNGSPDASFIDYDGDGDLDIFNFSDLYRNPGENGNHWLAVSLVGAGTETGTTASAHHVKIEVTAGGKTYYREHNGMAGPYSQHILPTHFGLGQATQVDELRITWMSGQVDVHQNLAVDQYIEFQEEVNCPPAMMVASDTLIFCVGQSLSLSATTSEDLPYYWSVLEGPDTDPNQFSNPNLADPSFSPSKSGTYLLGVRYTTGCPGYGTVRLIDTDYNNNGTYDLGDLHQVLPSWLGEDETVDFDKDNQITVLDYLKMCLPVGQAKRK